MMNGKAVQHAFWGHLVCQCLMHQIVTVIADEPRFEILVQELDRQYSMLDMSEINLETLLKSDFIKRISHTLVSKKSEFSNNSKMSKLWLNYLGVAQELGEADHTGSWQMHLHAISDCLPIFAATGHPNYLKS